MNIGADTEILIGIINTAFVMFLSDGLGKCKDRLPSIGSVYCNIDKLAACHDGSNAWPMAGDLSQRVFPFHTRNVDH